MRQLRAAIITVVVAIGMMAALIVVFAWRPWKSEYERETRWLTPYVLWTDEIAYAISVDDKATVRGCAEAFEERVGPAPPRLDEAARIALQGCRQIQSLPLDEAARVWHDTALNASRALLESHSRTSTKVRTRLFEPRAIFIVGRRPVVYCWSPSEWGVLNEQFGRVSPELTGLEGFALPASNRFHLGPQTCAYLQRLFTTKFSPLNSTETVRLAEAVITFAHEAEHLRVPRASEGEVQCYALQRVRAIALAAGRSERYANELAAFGWDVVQSRVPPEYQTEDCYDGGPLDLNPGSRVWP